MIELDSLWRENSTGKLVQVHWVSTVLVSYVFPKEHPDEERTVRTVRQFSFLQDFTKEIQDGSGL
jgi:hypothetical protein